MNAAELLFLDACPGAVGLYAPLRETILLRWPNTRIRVQKTQISFVDPCLFLCVSLPRRAEQRRAGALLVSFSLPERAVSPRILQAAIISPNRVTHHLLLTSPKDLDAELMAWIARSHR